MAEGIRIKIGLDGVQQAQAGANAVASSLNKVEQAQQSFIGSLREQVATYGKSADEALRYRAAQLGVGAAAAPLILQLQNQRVAQDLASKAAREEAEAQRQAAAAKKSLEASQQSFLKGLQDQVALQGKSQAEMLRYRAAQLGVSADAEKYIAQIQKIGQANTQVGASQGKLAQQTFQAGQQLQDFFIQLQGGVNPLTALVQQGSQLTAVYGGVGNAVRGVVGLLTPLSVALGGAAAAAVATALAYKQGAAESDAYAKALILTGNIAGTTTGALKEMAKAQAAVAGTQGQAAAVLTQLAASGQVAATELSKAAAAAIKLERAGGPAAEETAKKFAELGKTPLQAVVRLNEAENFLTVSVYKQIRALELQGKTVEAAAVAQKAYADALEGRGTQLEGRLGLIEKAWRGITGAAKGAWDAMLNIGREKSVEERLEDVGNALARAQEKAQPRRGSAPRTGLANVYGDPADDFRSQYQGLNAGAGYERLSAYYQSAGTKDTQKTIEQTTKALELQAAQAASAYAIAAAKIKGEIEQIQSAAKRGLLGPIEAIEKEGDKRVELLKAERQQLVANLAVAKQTIGGQAQVAQITGQIAAKDIELGNERIAVQNKVAEAIYATKKAAEELYRQQRDEAEKSLAEEQVKNRDIFNQRFDQVQEYARGIDDANEALALEAQLIGGNVKVRDVLIERLRIEQEERRKLREIDSTAGLLPEQRDKLKQSVREASAKALAQVESKAYLEEYKRIYDDLSQGLTDALIDGGKSARDYIKGLFRNLVLQPLLRPLVAPIAGSIASLTTGSAIGADGMAQQGGTYGQLGTAANLFSAGQKLYDGFASGFSSVGSSAASLYSYGMTASGTTYGTGFGTQQSLMLAQQEYGMGAMSGASGSSAIGSAASTAAGAAVGVYGGRAISGGYAAPGSNSGNSYVNAGTAIGAAVGSIVPAIGTAVGAAVGGILGGVVNRAFGYKQPEVESRTLEGTFTGGNFAGETVTNILQKGGWFKSDKRNSVGEAVTGELDKALDEGGRQIVSLATKYGEALGLPVERLAQVSEKVSVEISTSAIDELSRKYGVALNMPFEQLSEAAKKIAGTTEYADALEKDAAANQQAVARALGRYGEALLGAFAPDIEPLRKAGETVAQAIERVGGSLLGVNDALETLGLTALQSSLDGAKAALALQDLFGGASNFAQSAASYYQKFYTEAERADLATAQITETLGKLGLAFPKTRDEFRALVDDAAKSLDTDAGRQSFATLLSVADGVDAIFTNAGKGLRKLEDILRERTDLEAELYRLQGDTIALRKAEREAIDESNRALYDQIKALEDQQALLERQRSLASGVDSVAGDFLKGSDLANYKASRIVDILKEGGIDASVQGILGSTRADILSLWQAVGIDGREAILSAYSAWEDLQEILYGTQRAVDAYRGTTLSDRIFKAGIASLPAADRVTQLKNSEKFLFGQLTTAKDPVEVAERLTGVITERLSLEASLTKSVGEQRLDTLREELDAAKSLRDVVTGLPQFTASLRFSDVSPLSAQQQLGEAQKLFESTLTRTLGGDKLAAANLQTNAQAYISEAISAYGSGPQAASVFTRVTGALDQVAAQLGPVLDPQIAALESQVTSLSSIDETAGSMLAALLSIDAILAGRGTGGAGAATTPADPLADIGNTAGAVTGAIANAADTTTQAARADAVAAQLATVAGKLDAISANTRPIAAGVAVDQEGYTQMVARQRALEAKLDELLAVVRYGQTATT